MKGQKYLRNKEKWHKRQNVSNLTKGRGHL